ncbi:MAG: sulfotransferase family 2 domain-containing protein [Alphaproteobacteria bacterium]
MISHDHKAIMVHVPKTGGTSVEYAFGFIKIDKPEDFVPRAGLHDADAMGPKHARARRLKLDYPEIWNEYFTFAFVRNPWDRLVSSYHWAKQGNKPRLQKFNSFEEFVLEMPNIKARLKNTQLNFIANKRGKILVDFVGRTETMDRDFAHVCERIGSDLELPRINTSKRGDYTEYYTDEMRKIVDEVFADDIEAFGYKFGEDVTDPIMLAEA